MVNKRKEISKSFSAKRKKEFSLKGEENSFKKLKKKEKNSLVPKTNLVSLKTLSLSNEFTSASTTNGGKSKKKKVKEYFSMIDVKISTENKKVN